MAEGSAPRGGYSGASEARPALPLGFT